jgi:hypothetical protein
MRRGRRIRHHIDISIALAHEWKRKEDYAFDYFYAAKTSVRESEWERMNDEKHKSTARGVSFFAKRK